MSNYRSNQEEHPAQPADNAVHAGHARIESLQRLATQLASGQIPAGQGVVRMALANAGRKEADPHDGTTLRALSRQWGRLLEEAERDGLLLESEDEVSEEEAQEAAQRHQTRMEECTRQEKRQEERDEERLSFFYAEMVDEWGPEAVSDIESEPPEWKVAWERFKATGQSGLVGPMESPSQAADLKRAAQRMLIDLAQGRRGATEALAWQALLASLAPPRTEEDERPLAERFAAVQQARSAAMDEEEARLASRSARWEEGMAAIEHHRQRVEQEDPDRGQLYPLPPTRVSCPA